MKLKQCNECEKYLPIWKNFEGKKYCVNCWNKIKPKTPQEKKVHFIAPRSKKRVKQELEYSGKRKLFLLANPVCKANIAGCTTVSTDVHHMAGRSGEMINDMTEWLAVCRHCHTWIENQPTLAKKLEFSKSRINKQEDE